MNTPHFTLGQETWDLYRKVEDDEKRHRKKVQEALRRNLVDLISEESILLSDGRRIVRVPIESLEEHRFRYEENTRESGGPGAQTGAGGSGSMPPEGHEGGERAGLWDLVDSEITLENADPLVFQNLTLPDWDPDKKAPGGVGGYVLEGLTRAGPRATLSRRDTLKAALRHQGSGALTIWPPDIRHRSFVTSEAEEAGAVVLAMMDTSGSMGSFEKFLARSFFFWTVRFLKTRYPRVELVFLAHDVRAREVDEDTFFHRGASGGTVSSSVYRLAQEVLTRRFPPDKYNAYGFHFTDGGNLTSDNPQALAAGETLASQLNLFGYGEIHDTARNPSPLYTGFVHQAHTRAVVVRGKSDVFVALQEFFRASRTEAGHVRVSE